MRVAVVHATTHGHTAKIAARLAETMAAEDADVEVVAAGVGAAAALKRADAVVVAGSVHRGSHQPELSAFVTHHRRLLRDMPSAFVSVSLTAAEEDEELRAETRRMIDEFVEDTDWTPDMQAAVAGAFEFSKYNPFERLIMRLIARAHDIAIDPHKDLDMTDWDAVDVFAREFVARARRQPEAPSAPTR